MKFELGDDLKFVISMVTGCSIITILSLLMDISFWMIPIGWFAHYIYMKNFGNFK